MGRSWELSWGVVEGLETSTLVGTLVGALVGAFVGAPCGPTHGDTHGPTRVVKFRFCLLCGSPTIGTETREIRGHEQESQTSSRQVGCMSVLNLAGFGALVCVCLVCPSAGM